MPGWMQRKTTLALRVGALVCFVSLNWTCTSPIDSQDVLPLDHLPVTADPGPPQEVGLSTVRAPLEVNCVPVCDSGHWVKGDPTSGDYCLEHLEIPQANMWPYNGDELQGLTSDTNWLTIPDQAGNGCTTEGVSGFPTMEMSAVTFAPYDFNIRVDLHFDEYGLGDKPTVVAAFEDGNVVGLSTAFVDGTWDQTVTCFHQRTNGQVVNFASGLATGFDSMDGPLVVNGLVYVDDVKTPLVNVGVVPGGRWRSVAVGAGQGRWATSQRDRRGIPQIAE